MTSVREINDRNSSELLTLSAVEMGLQAEIPVFLRRWGDTGWRIEIDKVGRVDDPDLLRLIRGAAAIEHDAFYMQVKLGQLGVLRSPAIQQFNAVWLTEESDHGRTFDELLARLDPDGACAVPVAHNTLARDPRAILALPLMRLARCHRRAALGGYVIRGAMVEHVAIGVYGTLMRRLNAAGEAAGAEVVRRILLQEGRHLRFFTRAAKLVLGGSPVTASLVRRATEATWRPPGVDLYGKEQWAKVFLPVLSDPQALNELAKVDEKLGALPGFEGSTIVHRYFQAAANSARAGRIGAGAALTALR